MSTVRVRFAPSPTGYLHIGSVRTALFNWLYARHTGGAFVLRIEDTDEARNTPESLATILDGLRWLGLNWDEGPGQDGDHGPYFQSKRGDRYARRIDELRQKDLAYERDGAVRFRMTTDPVTIDDLIAGPVTRALTDRETADPDFVIVRSDGRPVFHLVNVIDDLEMGITHVIRGEDHLSNTAKHVALFRAFDAPPPAYAHIPMILNVDGSKMSKSASDPDQARLASLQTYIDDGYLPAAVRNYLCLLGWSPKDDRQVLPIDEVITRFDLPQVLRSNAKFDREKLEWMNGEYLKTMTASALASIAQPFLEAAGIQANDEPYLHRVLDLLKEKVRLLKELPPRCGYFFTEDYPLDPAAVEKSCTAPETAERLNHLAAGYEAVTDWTATALEDTLKAVAEQLGIKNKFLIHPCRVAVSGMSVGPSLYHMLEVLGRDRVLDRLRRAPARFRS